jgi:long-chain acyl-CoA synthetase
VLARLAKQVEVALGEVPDAQALSLPQYRLLGHLDEASGAVSSALAGRLQVTRPSITAIVDGLEARGFVERRACADDRRRIELHLTPAGRDALRAADAAAAGRLAGIADRLDPDERDAAEAGLVAWGTALNRTREERLQGTSLPAGSPPAGARAPAR